MGYLNLFNNLYYENFTGAYFYVYDRHMVEHCVTSILFYVSQVSVVHVCEATLTKRLIEFENTDAGSLTVCLFLPWNFQIRRTFQLIIFNWNSFLVLQYILGTLQAWMGLDNWFYWYIQFGFFGAQKLRCTKIQNRSVHNKDRNWPIRCQLFLFGVRFSLKFSILPLSVEKSWNNRCRY
jgi:hypothetical protein